MELRDDISENFLVRIIYTYKEKLNTKRMLNLSLSLSTILVYYLAFDFLTIFSIYNFSHSCSSSLRRYFLTCNLTCRSSVVSNVERVVCLFIGEEEMLVGGPSFIIVPVLQVNTELVVAG